MWILEWIPDWFFYLILLTGLVGFFITYLIRFLPIPQIYIHKTAIQLVSIVLVVFGTFMAGAVHDNEAWQRKIDELQEKLVKAETLSKEANDKLNEEVKNKKEKIVQKQVVVKQYIDREVTKYDSTCVIPKEFVNAHNQSAEDVRK
jgi:hypothetical protein